MAQKEERTYSELAKALSKPPKNRLYKMAYYLYYSKPNEYTVEEDYFDDGIFRSFRLLCKKTEEVLIDWTLFEKVGKPVL